MISRAQFLFDLQVDFVEKVERGVLVLHERGVKERVGLGALRDFLEGLAVDAGRVRFSSSEATTLSSPLLTSADETRSPMSSRLVTAIMCSWPLRSMTSRMSVFGQVRAIFR